MVIQRWQSVLLLMAAIVMGCFSFCSLGQITTADFTFNFTSLGIYYEGEATDGAPTGALVSTWYFFALSITTTILLLIDIFLYKNLSVQKKVAWIALMFTVACVAIGATNGYCVVENGSIGWSSLALAPFIAIVATLLAINRINSDHNKLKAVDRIR